MQDLLNKFNLEKNKRILLIFDVDGTLRPDTVESLDHRYPKVDPTIAKQLMNLNTLDNVSILILTARSPIDLYRSNLPKNIKKYCGFGKQLMEGEHLKYTREDFASADSEIAMFIEILKDIMGPKMTAGIDFLTTPGDFAIYFESQDFQEQKIAVTKILEMVLVNSKRWQILDFGRELIIKDAKYPYTKGDAIFDILNFMDLSVLHQVFFFGDSNDDYKAMVALRQYQQIFPNKRIKVNNICVGPALKGKELVDFEFMSYKDTISFVNSLYAKLFKE
jgi:hydroxymethylpyrimidine pyrophosphatase-like HAD family hydrolase